jgi:TolB-like protein
MGINIKFSAEEITQQTNRILDYPMFRNSPVLSRFLDFIIGETVHKRALQIKEYSIAINVLNRSNNFNPTGDSIVRIHAGRLRRALNDYYLTKGIYDPIIISIPKGCYVPEFIESGTATPTSKRQPVHHEPGNKPLVAIFPFRTTSLREEIHEFMLVLKELLSAELLSIYDLSVIGYYSDEMNARIKDNVLEAGKAAHADYIITGSVTPIGDRIRILLNLLNTQTGEVMLCKSFDKKIQFRDCIEIDDAIVPYFTDFSDDCYRILILNSKSNLSNHPVEITEPETEKA